MNKTIEVRVRTLAVGLTALLIAALAVSTLQPLAAAEEVKTDTFTRFALEGSLDLQPGWELQTRTYEAGKSGTWDAYVLNTRTGELYFVNQGIMTEVVEGQAKGVN